MNSPAKKVRSTESRAYENVQAKVETNGSRMSGSVKTSLKFASPMLVRQPWSISSPAGVAYDPLPLSEKTTPVSMLVKVSASGS